MTNSPSARSGTSTAVRVDGKFLEVGGRRFLVKGVAYGTFAPDSTGAQFPDARRLTADLSAIAAAGFNTVRTYTVPSAALLDAAAREGLRVMVGMPWPQQFPPTEYLDLNCFDVCAFNVYLHREGAAVS